MERVGFSIAYTAMAKQAGASEALKGSVLSAFYWGYGLSQVPTSSPCPCCKLQHHAGAVMPTSTASMQYRVSWSMFQQQLLCTSVGSAACEVQAAPPARV